jgi:hypothetical protein
MRQDRALRTRFTLAVRRVDVSTANHPTSFCFARHSSHCGRSVRRAAMRAAQGARRRHTRPGPHAQGPQHARPYDQSSVHAE